MSVWLKINSGCWSWLPDKEKVMAEFEPSQWRGNLTDEQLRRMIATDIGNFDDDQNFAIKAPQLFPLVLDLPEGERVELKVRKARHRIAFKDETEQEVTVVFEPHPLDKETKQ